MGIDLRQKKMIEGQEEGSQSKQVSAMAARQVRGKGERDARFERLGFARMGLRWYPLGRCTSYSRW